MQIEQETDRSAYSFGADVNPHSTPSAFADLQLELDNLEALGHDVSVRTCGGTYCGSTYALV